MSYDQSGQKIYTTELTQSYFPGGPGSHCSGNCPSIEVENKVRLGYTHWNKAYNDIIILQ